MFVEAKLIKRSIVIAIKAFYARGCRYLQFDDTSWGEFCDQNKRDDYASRGLDLDQIAKNYVKMINEALEAATATVDFVEVNKDAKKGTYVRYPERKELFTAQEINELLVVEFYNR